MPAKRPHPMLKLGDRVRIPNLGGLRGRVVELRGPLGPDGEQVYRVRVGQKPNPSYIELREDQLEVVPARS